MPSLPATFTDTHPLPKLLVFDLDYTLWPFWVDTHAVPPFKPHPAAAPPHTAVRDSSGEWLAFYPDVPGILHSARTAGMQVAVASRTHAPDLARDLLRLLRVYPPSSYSGSGSGSSSPAASGSQAGSVAGRGAGAATEIKEAQPANRFFDNMQIYPGDKVAHFKRIQAATGVPYEEMIFFDDEARNRSVERELGVLFIIAPRGVDAELVDRGVRRWREVRGRG